MLLFRINSFIEDVGNLNKVVGIRIKDLYKKQIEQKALKFGGRLFMLLSALPALSDNYIYLLQGPQGAIVIDPGEPKDLGGVHLLAILLTHHHSDHVAGAEELKERYGAPIIGPDEISFVDEVAKEKFTIGGFDFETIHTPGHTLGHVCYFLPKEKVLFCGDMLFGAGCGRLFEGDAEMMFTSLQKLKKLPDETLIYYGHEYTQRNLEFAQSIEPENREIEKRLKGFRPMAFPSLLLEKQTNPFLRAKSAEEFAALRTLRDQLS